MNLTVDHQDVLLAWAARKLGTDGWPKESRAYGVVEPREGMKPLLRAVIVVNSHHGASCRIHIASDGSRKWATRDVLARLAAFIHIGMKVNRIWTVVSVANVPAIITCLKIGFQIQGRVARGADDGSDGIIVSMFADENPWLKGEDDGKGSTAA